MALLWMEGFDSLVSADLIEKYNYTGSSPTVGTTQKRTGTSAMASGVIGKTVAVSGTTCVVGYGHYQGASLGSTVIVNIGGHGSSACWQMQVTINNSTGAVEVWAGPAMGTLLATSAPNVCPRSCWNYIEFKAVIDNSGSVTVKVNGNTVITQSGIDTQCQAAAGWDGVQFVLGTSCYIDDVYIADGSGAQNNNFLGECRVVCLLPSTGNGSNTDFTCSASTDHGALVDEAAPNDDTDYVYSSTVDHVDSWNYPALGYTGTIKGVQMNLSARKTDSGTRAIAAVTRPASTNRVHGTNHYLGTSYVYWPAIWETNPEDSAAWEVADVDGAEFGVKITV